MLCVRSPRGESWIGKCEFRIRELAGTTCTSWMCSLDPHVILFCLRLFTVTRCVFDIASSCFDLVPQSKCDS